MTGQQTDRLKQIRERIDAATPNLGKDREDAPVFEYDDEFASLAIRGLTDADAAFIAAAPSDVAWLLAEVELRAGEPWETLAKLRDRLGVPHAKMVEALDKWLLKDRGKTQEINRLVREVRSQEAEIHRLRAALEPRND